MKRIISLASLIIFLAIGASAQSHAPSCNLDAGGLAIEGYDPVSYFTTGKPVEGNKDYSYAIDGATYRFVSARNRDLFKAAPSKYRPQYGGWCAYAMGAKGEKVEVDPETFKILDGKLYLFYNKYFNNTLKSWNKDEANLKGKADANWTRQNTK
jgi:YHS domain-containing protein